ncbi:MAG: glycerol-3-phosphate acyltransferase [Acidobacteriota bacterium]
MLTTPIGAAASPAGSPADPGFLILLAVAFFVGSLPFAVWISRLAAGIDIRQHGSWNPGAANVWRSVGRRYGVLVGSLDAVKGAAMVWLAWWAGQPDPRAVWAGVAAVVGHNFSPFLGFRGGKGGATTVGLLACFIFPELVVVGCLLLLGSLVMPSRRFLASIIALSTSPLLALATGRLAFLPYFGAHPPRTTSVVWASLFLVALLWFRVTPGLLGKRARDG